MFKHGSHQFLFTGDLEAEGEEKLAEKYDFDQVKLYKAGHHGSKTSSTEALLSEIRPEICVVTCVAGTDEYTSAKEIQFPSQPFINRISKYTERVYVTTIGDPNYTNGQDYLPMNGNIIVSSSESGVSVNCSNNNTLLKDTAWFKENRSPAYWAA